MTREEIWNGFTKLFPDKVKNVDSYTKIGSKTIKLTLKAPEGEEPKHLIFLYNNIWDWTFGTKVWRKKPYKKEDNNHEV
jgi:hypothetical protein